MTFVYDHRGEAYRHDNILYLTGNNHVFTRAGHMDDDHDMPEEYVKAFIRYCKPELLTQLHGLPISSRDIPMSFHGQRSLRRSSQMDEKNRQYAFCLDMPDSSEESVMLEIDTITPDRLYEMESAPLTLYTRAPPPSRERSSISPPRQRRRLGPDVYPSWAVQKAAETIKYKLQNGFCMYSKVLHDTDYPLPCSFPFCKNLASIPLGTKYISFEYDYQQNSITSNHTISRSAQQFCADCFNTVYPTVSDVQQADAFIPSPQSSLNQTFTESETHLLMLDGIPHDTIVTAAIRLYPTLSATRYNPNTASNSTPNPDILKYSHGYYNAAFNYPSNSTQSLSRRNVKNLEIDSTLAEVAKYEKAIAAFRRQQEENSLVRALREDSPDASVLITRPAYLEPVRERYRKQGLTKHDLTKYRVKVKQEEDDYATVFPDKPFVSPTIAESLHPKDRYCYCREGELPGTELIRCASERCPVGWFHLSCTGLERLPTTRKRFYCRYCADDLGPFVSKKIKMMDQDEQSIIEEVEEQENIDPEGYDRSFGKEYDLETTYHLEEAGAEDDDGDYDSEDVNSEYAFAWSAADALLHNTMHRWGIAVNDSQAMARFSRTGTEVGVDDDDDSTVTTFESSALSSVSEGSSTATVEEEVNEGDDTDTEDVNEASDAGNENETDEIDDINASDSSEETITAYSYLTPTPTIEDISDLSHLPHPFSSSHSKLLINRSTTTSPSYSRSTLSPSPSVPLPSNIATNTDDAKTPRTPFLAPIRISTRPWGTPVNLDRLILEPQSPTPLSAKRKFDEFGRDGDGEITLPDLDSAAKSFLDLDEIPDSQDSGVVYSDGGRGSDAENVGEGDEDEAGEDGSEEVTIMLDVESLKS